MPEKKYVNSRELSEIISIPVSTIRRLVREKKIPAYQIGDRNYLFKPDEVEECIRKGRVN